MKVNNKLIIIIAVVAVLAIGLFRGLAANKQLDDDIAKATELIGSGNYSEAQEILSSQVSRNGSRRPQLYILSADCYIGMGDIEGAVELLEHGEIFVSNNDEIIAKLEEIKEQYADELAEPEQNTEPEQTAPKDTHGVSDELWANIEPAVTAIGIPSDDVRLSQDKDWAFGARYKFSYSGLGFTVYMNEDNTVNSINSGDIKFFENGEAVYNANDFTVDYESEIQVRVWAQDAVTSKLKSPSTAKFAPYGDWNVSRNGTTYTVSGYVDAQNSFGATLRNSFTVKIEWDGTGNGTVTDVIISE